MVYAASDLHGCPLRRFQALLDKANFCEEDFLFILGDVIDRSGDGGIELLQWIMLQPNVQLLLGNHEAMLLACSFLFEEITDESLDRLTPERMEALSCWLSNGAEPTLKALRALNRESPDAVSDLLDCLREAPLYETVSLDSGDFLLVHAGLGNFRTNKRLSEYTADELLWTRPERSDQYFDGIMTILGHTPAAAYGAAPGRAFRTQTWIDIDAGQDASPLLLRLNDLTEISLN